MLADKLEEWALEYLAEGKAEGKAEGEMLALQRILSKRFGPIPADITAKIASATVVDIENWIDKAIDAVQLKDIFDQ